MFSSKFSITIWLIYSCFVIKLSFIPLYVDKQKLLLFRNYSENLHETCHQTFPSLLMAYEGEKLAADAGVGNINTILHYAKNGGKIEWDSANGSIQTKFSKMRCPSLSSRRADPLSEGNTVINSSANIQLNNSCNALIQKSLEEEKNNFFVITAIFNPVSYKSRYTLYHTFAKHMNDTGAQLITIECIFPSLNQHEFQVTEKNNPWHIQLKSESVYWMKENLINIAVSRLPPHAKWISWLDADIEFEEKNWVELTIKELKRYTAVQMFEKANFLGPSPRKEVLRVDYSFGYSVVHNKPIDRTKYGQWYPHPGYGWAMSVNDFRKMKGLPDYNIDGSGDRFFAYSLINKISGSFRPEELKLPSLFLHLILDVGNQTFKTLQEISKSNFKSMLGYAPVTINHNWHGSTKNRLYGERWKIFRDNNFNFQTDVSVNEDGLFQLTQTKPKLHADLLTYFRMRHEDKTVTYTQADTKKCKARLNFYEEGSSRKYLENNATKN